jgi:hypothetical protein
MRNAYKAVVGKPEGKIPLGRPRHRLEDNSKMHLREIGLEDVDWHHLARDSNRRLALVNTIMEYRFHKIRDFLDYLRNC